METLDRTRRLARRSQRALTIVLVLGLSACLVEHGDPKLGGETTLESLSVSDEAGGGSCSTTVVRGLVEQLVAEANCMQPGTYRRISSIPRVSLGSAAATAPYLQHDAATALSRAASRGSGTIAINSGMRTIAQQYLLKRWAERGRCGISAAASPGRSNHESGLAIDVSDYSTWRTRLEAEGFRWFGSGDRVHFDYTGGRDLRSVSVRAFQRLWNRNHPDDRIAEDGSYGPATESRLRRAPAEGFPRGASCGGPADSGGTDPTPTPTPAPTPVDPDGGMPMPAPTPTSSPCAAGVECADCNAIAEECGFCAGTGACMEGNASGPFSGTCTSGWQWMAPSACPMPAPSPSDPPPSDPPPADPPPSDPPPMCLAVRDTSCASGGACCTGLTCRSGVSYGVRCCAEGGTSCSSGSDCCGYMDCVSGTCACRASGRACLANGDCCSSRCVSGRCG